MLEILVTSLIIAVIASAVTSGAMLLRNRGRMMAEMGAGRNLIQAYVTYAAENGGSLLPGYKADPEATNDEGKSLTYPANARYPWRLYPHVSGIRGTLLLNGNEKYLERENKDYMVSVLPSYGINAVLVGGHFGSGSPLRPDARMVDALGKFYVSKLYEAQDSDRLLVFASARSDHAGESPGYFEVRPPNLLARQWSSKPYEANGKPEDHGYVDFRWGGKASVAFLSGRVAAMTEEELRDMRLWSNQACQADDADYTIRRK